MNNKTISKEEEETRRREQEEEDYFLKHHDLVNYLRLRTSELSLPAEAEAEAATAAEQQQKKKSTTTIFPFLVSVDQNNYDLWFADYSNYESYYIHLPETKNMRFCGSSEGWLIMVSNTVGLARIFLFQPFSRALIELPQGSNTPIIPERYSRRRPLTDAAATATAPYFIRKAILSSSPSVSNQDWAVAAIDSSGKLFFYYHDRNQQSNYWISSKEDDYEACGGRLRTFEDVMFFGGRFYALQTNGSVTPYNIRGSESGPTLNFMGGYETGFTNYLVEAKGEFLMVSRICWEDRGYGRMCWEDGGYGTNKCSYRTNKFNVFRLEARWGWGIKGGIGTWVKVEDTQQFLGDQVLFLGAGCSKSVNVVDCPGYKANHIYFSDDNFHRCYDLGMPFMCNDNGLFSMGPGGCFDMLRPISPNPDEEFSMETPKYMETFSMETQKCMEAQKCCRHPLMTNAISPVSPPLWFHAYPMMINPFLTYD